MTSLVEAVGQSVIGTVEEVFADRISVLLDPDAPQATALNAGTPTGFPRINGYVLIPNETGATACIVSSVRITRLPFPKRTGTQKDFGLVDLPFPSRMMTLVPIGTLKARSTSGELSFRVQRGVDVFPSVGDLVHLPTVTQLRAIVQGEEDEANRILLGHCPTAARAPVHVDPDKLFGRHLAVLGNTGAGKSCTVAGLVRWSLEAAKKSRRGQTPNARFIVLDPNGEYGETFRDLGVRVFQVGREGDARSLKVPAWLWTGAEWAVFTEAAPGVQRPLLFEALRRLRSGAGPPGQIETKIKGRVSRYRSRLKVLIGNREHQLPGKREGTADVLENIHKDFQDLAEQSEVEDSSMKAALEAVASTASRVEQDARGRSKEPSQKGFWHSDFAETDLAKVSDALQRAADHLGLDEDEVVADEDSPIPFPIGELPDYVEALAADQSGRDIAQFVDTLMLRIRRIVAGGRLSQVVQTDDNASPTLVSWLDDYIGADNASNGPIAVLDLSLVPSEVMHVVVSVLGRMVFEALQRYRRKNGCELPTTLVLEEAHTFIHRDLHGESTSPAGRECSRVFERIAREGRKFGMGLVLASQRPSEISPTVLSQCNTFLLHRLVNDRDQELVRHLVPDGLGTLLRELPSLPTRRAILLGWAAPAPTLVEVQDIPKELRPHSPDPYFWDVWTGAKSRKINWAKVAQEWQRRAPVSSQDDDPTDLES